MKNKKKNFIIANIILLVVAIIFLSLFTEIILRVFGISCSIIDENNNGPFLASNEGYHYMEPNYDGRFKCLTFDTNIKTNSYGFRDNEFNITEKSIILFGDSIAFGYGVEQKDTFAQVLENKLAFKGSDVYNLGVSGYSLNEYNWLYDKYSKELKHKLVLLIIYEGNDFQESCNLINRAEFVTDERKGFGFAKDLLKKSYTFRFLYPFTKDIVNFGETAITSKRFYMVDEPEEVRDCNKEFKKNLNELKGKIINNNKNLTVIIFPSKATFIESENPEIDYQKRLNTILDFCLELNLDCINLKEYINSTKEIYQKDSGHPNEEGHIKIAKLINEHIIKYNY